MKQVNVKSYKRNGKTVKTHTRKVKNEFLKKFTSDPKFKEAHQKAMYSHKFLNQDGLDKQTIDKHVKNVKKFVKKYGNVKIENGKTLGSTFPYAK